MFFVCYETANMREPVGTYASLEDALEDCKEGAGSRTLWEGETLLARGGEGEIIPPSASDDYDGWYERIWIRAGAHWAPCPTPEGEEGKWAVLRTARRTVMRCRQTIGGGIVFNDAIYE